MEIRNRIGRQNRRNYDVEIRKFEIEVSVELRWRNRITAERAKWILYFSTIEIDRKKIVTIYLIVGDSRNDRIWPFAYLEMAGSKVSIQIFLFLARAHFNACIY